MASQGAQRRTALHMSIELQLQVRYHRASCGAFPSAVDLETDGTQAEDTEGVAAVVVAEMEREAVTPAKHVLYCQTRWCWMYA